MNAERNPTDKCLLFLSSTWQDLKAHRAACIEVMQRLRNELGVDWVTMEDFGAVPESPKDYCRKQVRRCRLYVGIFGSRYGHIDEETGVSASELEYREAIDAKIPCLIYILDPSAQVPYDHVDTGSAAFKLAALKANLRDFTKGHIVQYFTSPQDLAARFAVDLVKAVRMLDNGGSPSGLRTTIEEAIAECTQFVTEMENVSTGGWSYLQIGNSTCWDTAFSLLALSATGQRRILPQLHRGQHFLLSQRNSFGGWRSSWEGNPTATTTMDTALAISSLWESGYEEQPWEIWRSADYLCQAQHRCGGWPYTFGVDEAVTGATAWAVAALVKVGWSPTTDVARRAMRWLIENQRFDGGWGVQKSSAFSTIGKTRDALMALDLLPSDESDRTIERGRNWLLRAREGFSSTEDFAKAIGTEPQGINPLVENTVLFLEGAFFAKTPPGQATIKRDLAWLAGRPLWSNTARALSCMCQYRKWLR